MKVAANSSLARRGTAVSVALLLAFLAAWQWGPGVLGLPVFIIPPLSSVFDEFLRMLAVSGLALKCMQPLSKIELVTVMLEPLSTSTLHCELSP